MKSRSAMTVSVATIVMVLLGSFGCQSAGSNFLESGSATAPASPSITISSKVPDELNPDGGGAQTATLQQAAAFAWQEFIALNWPAVPQTGALNTRDTADTSQKFGDPTYTGPLVWHTFRSKVEIYPGQGNPNGYMNDPAIFYGYDILPRYVYSSTLTQYSPTITQTLDGEVQPFPPATPDPTTPWINLDENSEIGLNTMYAGVASHTSEGGQILFLAKANRAEYTYVAANSVPFNYAPVNNPSFPSGTIEVKSAWRQLTADEIKSGQFYQTRVRYYRPTSNAVPGYVDEVWGMVALHIIQKTPSAPYFIYATFSQADNLLDVNGNPIEDVDGNLQTPTPNPLDPNIISTNAGPNSTQVLTPMTSTLSLADVGSRLYYTNTVDVGLPYGYIALNKREHDIPEAIITVNQTAHTAIKAYNQTNGITASPWMYYKLVSIQYQPYDKQPGITYTGAPDGPLPSTYYQANEVVESDYNLQVFSGHFGDGNLITDYNPTPGPANGTEFKNVAYNGKEYLMGGCMGCHGNAQVAGADFSFIFLGGRVAKPETVGHMPNIEKFQKLLLGK